MSGHWSISRYGVACLVRDASPRFLPLVCPWNTARLPRISDEIRRRYVSGCCSVVSASKAARSPENTLRSTGVRIPRTRP